MSTREPKKQTEKCVRSKGARCDRVRSFINLELAKVPPTIPRVETTQLQEYLPVLMLGVLAVLPAGGMLVGFPALWVLFEWLREWAFTGFPWLYLGYAHVDTWISGWAPITGVFGLSFICAISGTALYLAWRSRQPVSCTTYAVILVTLWGGGAILKPTQWVAKASERPLTVAMVQPNVPQEHKWDPKWYNPILQQLQVATDGLLGHDIVIWPESAIPGYYQGAQGFLQPMAQRASAANTPT